MLFRSIMLRLSGLDNFYYLPMLHDMRYKGPRLSEIILSLIHISSLIDAQFGHNELDNILEEALPDQLIQPGRLHRLLVQLPWKDILTDVYKRQTISCSVLDMTV